MCDIATDGIIFVRTDPDAREISGEYDSATKWERPINLDREVTKVKCGRERRRIWNRRVGIGGNSINPAGWGVGKRKTVPGGCFPPGPRYHLKGREPDLGGTVHELLRNVRRGLCFQNDI